MLASESRIYIVCQRVGPLRSPTADCGGRVFLSLNALLSNFAAKKRSSTDGLGLKNDYFGPSNQPHHPFPPILL
jgi:hypothetical protein